MIDASTDKIDHGPRKGFPGFAHRDTCHGSLCPVCGCCAHCEHDWVCSCNDSECMCNPKNKEEFAKSGLIKESENKNDGN